MKFIKSKKGFALLVVLGVIGISFLISMSYMTLAGNESFLARRYADSAKAFYLAEAGVERISCDIKLGNTNSHTFRIRDYSARSSYLDDVLINVNVTPIATNLYEVDSTATVGNATRTIHGLINRNPPAHVFDYAYFINNWGWFYGHQITVNGDVRSNGRFDFRDGPKIEGEIYAGEGIDDETPDGIAQNIRGRGGETEDGEYIHQQPYSEKYPVPMLQNIDYYANTAIEQGGSVSVDGATVINAVYGDDAGEAGSIVLVGTASNPIVISGPVVVTGDVIIKGRVEGQGTIYAGRNIYIAGDIDYKNTPSSPRPSSDDPSVTDGWVEANKDKDLIGLAAKENIVIGDYTSSSWTSNVTPYLYSMGSEDVGQDGIPGTGDAGEGDGVFQSQYEDMDGDGVFDGNYNSSNMSTSIPVTSFGNLPSGVTNFRDLAANNLNKIEGILYTNHAIAGRLGSGVHINGAIISKDEAMVFSNTLIINYDERIHSRYRLDPNWLINLDLPVADRVAVTYWWE